MKKSMVAAGVSAAVLAAMPAVSTFATTIGSVTDTVTLTVSDTCTLTSTGKKIVENESTTDTGGAYEYTATMQAGGAANSSIGETVMTIQCNRSGGWVLNAIGAGSATGDVSKMDSGNNVDSEDIASLDTPATTGNTSNWAFKVASNTASVIQGNYGSFSKVPTSATAVAKSTTATDITTGVTVSPTYQVYLASTQAAGTYTGKVTYTLLQPATATE